ncbi:hypothetical protein LEN26_008750 [Aphanomyces euteiches]|nr:hypothetical protein AeMF1_013986 [Aphanomyces euteiches]KAH9130201.1 hypothetical protein LEN26_008750 [Aphanomyces euteiches]KAH9182116.1 hypothetical protein AeNC1_015908 [Aphanomyces euteiches]
MTSRLGFTIEEARRNRISEATRKRYKSGINQIKLWARRVGKHELLMASEQESDGQTINLSVFQYLDFLEFIEWTVRNKKVEVGTISSYRSALKSLYKDQKVALPEEYGDDMKEVFSGLKKTIADDLQSGDKGSSGKRPLTFSKFQTFSERSLMLHDGGFTHLFLIFTWNLMCRSKSTETIRFDYISIEEDATQVGLFLMDPLKSILQ